jgi:micrococcal nuclease
MKWLFLLLWPVVAFAKYGNVEVSSVVRVYDGDTFFVDIDRYPEISGKGVGIRPYGIDTPEMTGKCARERELALDAKAATQDFLSRGPVMLHDMDRGKYFRILAHVRVNGSDLAEHLLKLGLAVPYTGDKKTHDWCAQ